MSRARADERTVTFLGPGAGGAGVPLVADLRSVELSDHPLLVGLRDRTGAVAREALAYAKGLAEVLPEEISARPSADLPSLWECFQHEFARYSLAPALMNREIARAALGSLTPCPLSLQERGWRETALPRARLVERRDGAWWLGGSGAAEAVAAANGDAPGAPPLSARWWRDLALEAWSPPPRWPLLPGGPRERRPEETAPPDQPCDVLFLGVAATTAPIIAYLTRGLEAEGLRCATVDFHYESSTAALRAAGLRVIDGLPAWPELRRLGPIMLGLPRRRGETAAGLHRLVAQGGLPAWLEPVVRRRLSVALGRYLPLTWAYRAVAGRILDAARPRLVVGFHLSPDFLAPLILAARLRGVPTVCSQHGLRGPVHRNGMALPWDLLLAWGQYTVDLYEGQVEEQSRWVVTGNCMYDGESRKSKVESRKWGPTSAEGIGPVVLAATQSDEGQVRAAQPRWWLRGVAEACRGLGASLVIRPHPAETALGRYEKLAAEFPGTVRLAREGTWEEALAEAGALVTRDSTVVYQAARAGKPALTVALPPYRPRFPLAEHGGALGVETYEEIRPALEDALSEGPRTRELARRRAGFLEYHLGPEDGEATERTLRVLRESMSL